MNEVIISQYKISNKFKLFETILGIASEKGNTEIVKLLTEQEKVDVNPKNVHLFCIMFILVILCLKITFGIYSNSIKHQLFLHLRWAILKSSNCFLGEMILKLMQKMFTRFKQISFHFFWISKYKMEFILKEYDGSYPFMFQMPY